MQPCNEAGSCPSIPRFMLANDSPDVVLHSVWIRSHVHVFPPKGIHITWTWRHDHVLWPSFLQLCSQRILYWRQTLGDNESFSQPICFKDFFELFYQFCVFRFAALAFTVHENCRFPFMPHIPVFMHSRVYGHSAVICRPVYCRKVISLLQDIRSKLLASGFRNLTAGEDLPPISKEDSLVVPTFWMSSANPSVKQWIITHNKIRWKVILWWHQRMRFWKTSGMWPWTCSAAACDSAVSRVSAIGGIDKTRVNN